MSLWAGKTVLMMAGGTGGHVYPALAVAHQLQSQGAMVHWLGNTQGFEGRKVPEAGFELHDIAVRGLRGNGALGWLKAPVMIARACFRARAVMRRICPDVVMGMGGFASGPGGLAAKWLHIPLVVHEQNAVMGLTNRWLAKFADLVLLADERASKRLPAKKAYVVTGNPVRADIVALPAPRERYAQHQGKIQLLVVGGSQGAKAMNALLPEALALLPEAARPLVTHQVGERWFAETQDLYQRLGLQATVVPFISDMAQAYAQADWVIARSGASTVAEVATVGLPALFIPFPFAVDDHQTANAQALCVVGAAQVCQQASLTAAALSAQIAQHNDRALLMHKAELARQCSHAKALEKIMTALEGLIS